MISIAAFVPEDQEEKLPLVREIRALATPENLSFLPPDRRMAVEQVLPPADLRPFGAADLPDGCGGSSPRLDGRRRHAGPGPPLRPHGRVGRPRRAPLRARSSARSRCRAGHAHGELDARVRRRARRHRRGRPARHAALARRASSLLLLVAFGLGKRSVRSLADAGWVLASLAVGVLWFGGLAGALELRLNMLNFIALPITFGIGVDYATNVFQRRRVDHAPLHRRRGPHHRRRGGALLAHHHDRLLLPAHRPEPGAHLVRAPAVIGEVACLAAALVALPAVLRLRERRREARKARDEAEAAGPGVHAQP